MKPGITARSKKQNKDADKGKKETMDKRFA
jgi:hypothetical protein